jgi:hypothetical protein
MELLIASQMQGFRDLEHTGVTSPFAAQLLLSGENTRYF